MQSDVIFIQIGSNEGVMDNDPICSLILKNGWKGVLIEPLPRAFEVLKKNYAGRQGLFFENVAISDKRGRRKFYTINKEAEYFKAHPNINDQTSSLDCQNIINFWQGSSEEDLIVMEVECVTLQDIVDKYQLKRVDVLHVDAEGHDDVILYSIDFKKIRPMFIIFEHYLMSFERYVACIGFLAKQGYAAVETGILDTVMSLEIN